MMLNCFKSQQTVIVLSPNRLWISILTQFTLAVWEWGAERKSGKHLGYNWYLDTFIHKWKTELGKSLTTIFVIIDVIMM